MKAPCDIGMVGLGVMGRNLVRNMAGRGVSVVVYDHASCVMDDFLSGGARSLPIRGCDSLRELAARLSKPRKIMLMAPAGKPVDDLIGQLIPLLDPGDIVIDGGNSHYHDTARRSSILADHGVRFIGMGISGGEKGALHGPAIMAGGSPDAWAVVRGLFESLAAKARDGLPCCGWMGEGGAGHFVKMVHNGIEYADMQLIAETYDFLRRGVGLDTDELSGIFARWNMGELESYLTSITAGILKKRDELTGAPLVDMILDTAGQKGTGQWTSAAALELGVSAPTIAESVFARFLSAGRDERLTASVLLTGPGLQPESIPRPTGADMAGQALQAAKICVFAQGFRLMKAAADEYGWKLDYALIARIWRAGCIIRAGFLDHVAEAFENDPGLRNLMLSERFRTVLAANQDGWRKTVTLAIGRGIPVPALSSALAWYDGCRSALLPANLIQAQRDCFGAHTYERIDKPRGECFHTDWME